MTAEEARKLTEKSANVDDKLSEIYKKIDHEIEVAAVGGDTFCYVGVNVIDETWSVIDIEREKIKKHYTDLGYSVEYVGYEGNITSDEFIISW